MIHMEMGYAVGTGKAVTEYLMMEKWLRLVEFLGKRRVHRLDFAQGSPSSPPDSCHRNANEGMFMQEME